MFNGSRFFNLATKWGSEGKFCYCDILKQIMNHYFISLAYHDGHITDKNKLVIIGNYSADEITYVLKSVGYKKFDLYSNANKEMEVRPYSRLNN